MAGSFWVQQCVYIPFRSDPKESLGSAAADRRRSRLIYDKEVDEKELSPAAAG